MCILQFGGKMLYICNWVSPKFTFQTVYIRTERLLFLSVIGLGRWTISHYSDTFASFSFYLSHLFPYIFEIHCIIGVTYI